MSASAEDECSFTGLRFRRFYAPQRWLRRECRAGMIVGSSGKILLADYIFVNLSAPVATKVGRAIGGRG